MLRIWKGIEKEGIGQEAAIPTLFICSNAQLSSTDILPILKDNNDIKGLYFGAGRVEFAGIDVRSWDEVVAYCKLNNINIVIEVSPMMLDVFVKLYNAPMVTFVIAYYNAPKNINKLYFKTDDFVTTKIYTPEAVVDITEVVDNRYPDDVLLLERS